LDFARGQERDVIIFVGGGSRSGKSRYALELAQQRGKRPAFLATAQAFDGEMTERIRQHREERGDGFVTVEEPFELASALRTQRECDVIVVDCLTLWVSNLMLSDREIPTEELITAARECSATVIFVSNEVGCGIVPENALARRFRDLAGALNQRVAAAADEVYWMAFGIPLKVK
jgi:adenosylcobinamide kinase/adenosylcobinamide-phosphate guanylyltransferase